MLLRHPPEGKEARQLSDAWDIGGLIYTYVHTMFLAASERLEFRPSRSEKRSSINNETRSAQSHCPVYSIRMQTLAPDIKAYCGGGKELMSEIVGKDGHVESYLPLHRF
jgi:hypothetical protein